MPEWLKTVFIRGFFGTGGTEAGKKYRTFVEELLGKDYDSPLREARGAAVLGTPGFVEMVTAAHIGKRAPARDLPALRQFRSRPSLDELLAAVDAVFGQQQKLARQAGMYLCHRYSGEKVREIANRFNVGESAITEAARLFSKRLEKDEGLADEVARVVAMLKI